MTLPHSMTAKFFSFWNYPNIAFNACKTILSTPVILELKLWDLWFTWSQLSSVQSFYSVTKVVEQLVQAVIVKVSFWHKFTVNSLDYTVSWELSALVYECKLSLWNWHLHFIVLYLFNEDAAYFLSSQCKQYFHSLSGNFKAQIDKHVQLCPVILSKYRQMLHPL